MLLDILFQNIKNYRIIEYLDYLEDYKKLEKTYKLLDIARGIYTKYAQYNHSFTHYAYICI